MIRRETLSVDTHLVRARRVWVRRREREERERRTVETTLSTGSFGSALPW